MLNQNDKFERFAQVINENADEKCEQINSQIQSVLQEQLTSMENSAAEELDRRLRADNKKIQVEINKKITAIEAQRKRIIARHRDEICEKVFDDVREKLRQFCLSQEYNEYLERAVMQVKDKLEVSFSVYVRHQDVEKMKEIAAHIPEVLTVETDNTVVLGGFVAVTKDGNVRVDCTVESDLEQQKEWFMANSFSAV